MSEPIDRDHDDYIYIPTRFRFTDRKNDPEEDLEDLGLTIHPDICGRCGAYFNTTRGDLLCYKCRKL